MTDKEKALRWDLQQAQEEMRKPLIDELPDFYTATMAFALKEQRQKNLAEAQRKLDEFLKA